MRTLLIGSILLVALVGNAQHMMRPKHLNTNPDPNLQPVGNVSIGPEIMVSSPEGVELYQTQTNGTVTDTGSQAQVVGSLAGATTNILVTYDPQNLYSYPVFPSSIGSQAFSVNAQGYPGGECGTPTNETLLSSGVLYIAYAGATDGSGDNLCDSIQSWAVSSAGDFTFLGSTEFDVNRFAQPSTALALTPNYAYNLTPLEEGCEMGFNTFSRDSAQSLNLISNPPEILPTPDPTGGDFFPLNSASDGGSHIAVTMFQDYAPPCGPMGAPQLAAFVVGQDGSITSTNDWRSMPYIGTGYPQVMSFDPTGKLLAIAGSGLEVYRFNGLTPPVLVGQTQIPNAGIGQMSWDQAGNLYAWGVDGDGLFKVFTFAVTNQQVSLTAMLNVAQDSTGMVTTE